MVEDSGSPPNSPRVSSGAREFLRAATIAGVSLERFRLREQIVAHMLPGLRSSMQVAIEELTSEPSPWIRLAEGGKIFLTPEGAIAAQRMFAEAETAGEPSIFVRRIQRRGTTNKEMAEYAASIGARLWQGETAVCSNCHEHNSFGVKSGRARVCQLCFSRGVRLG